MLISCITAVSHRSELSARMDVVDQGRSPWQRLNLFVRPEAKFDVTTSLFPATWTRKQWPTSPPARI